MAKAGRHDAMGPVVDGLHDLDAASARGAKRGRVVIFPHEAIADAVLSGQFYGS